VVGRHDERFLGDPDRSDVRRQRRSDDLSPAPAAHVRPVRVTEEALVVAADHPAWATQVRALGTTLLAQVGEATGRAPARLEVVVRPS